jgi:ketosteroid isomerase-like protein
MKKVHFLFITLIFTTLVFANYNKFPDVPDSLTACFNQNVKAWIDAYNSGEAKQLIPLYAEDADYLSSHVVGLVAKGRDRLIENFQNGMNGGGHIDTIEILSINYSCELAVLTCKYEATNSGQKAIGRNMLVLRKIHNKWLIIKHMTVV